MPTDQSPDQIRRLAKDLDDAVEHGDIEMVVSFFTDDCEVELPGVKLTDQDGLRRGLGWLYHELGSIRFEPVSIMVDGDTFFEEFVMRATREGDAEAEIPATEVLVYEGLKVRRLRIYFDRLAIAAIRARGLVEKWVVKKMERAALRGLG
jgi:ketosteroid isomerase-like protein